MNKNNHEEGDYIVIDPVQNRISEELKSIWKNIGLTELPEVKEEIIKFGNKLKKELGLKDSDSLNYKLWYILNDGISPDDVKDFDTKGNDIANFIKSLKKIK
jgi:hypothetical protein